MVLPKWLPAGGLGHFCASYKEGPQPFGQMKPEGQGLVGGLRGAGASVSWVSALSEPCVSKVQPASLEAVTLQVTRKQKLPISLPLLQVCSWN